MQLEYDVSMPWVCRSFKNEYEMKAEDIGYKLMVGHARKDDDETILVQAQYTKWDSFLHKTGSKKSKSKLENLIGSEFKYYFTGVSGEGEPNEKFPVKLSYTLGAPKLKYE